MIQTKEEAEKVVAELADFLKTFPWETTDELSLCEGENDGGAWAADAALLLLAASKRNALYGCPLCRT